MNEEVEWRYRPEQTETFPRGAISGRPRRKGRMNSYTYRARLILDVALDKRWI